MKGWKAVCAMRGRGHYDGASCRGKGEYTSCSEMPDFPCLAFVDFLFCFFAFVLVFSCEFSLLSHGFAGGAEKRLPHKNKEGQVVIVAYGMVHLKRCKTWDV